MGVTKESLQLGFAFKGLEALDAARAKHDAATKAVEKHDAALKKFQSDYAKGSFFGTGKQYADETANLEARVKSATKTQEVSKKELDKQTKAYRDFQAALRDVGKTLDVQSSKTRGRTRTVDAETDAIQRRTRAVRGTDSAESRASDARSRATRGMADVEKSATRAAGKKGGYGSGYGLLMLSEAVEDSQYGLNAVVNNIPRMVMAFGGAAGLAGAVSLAAVALNQMVQSGRSFQNLFKGTMFSDPRGLKAAGLKDSLYGASESFYAWMAPHLDRVGLGWLAGDPTGVNRFDQARMDSEIDRVKKRRADALKAIQGMDREGVTPGYGGAMEETMRRQPGGAKGLLQQLLDREKSRNEGLRGNTATAEVFRQEFRERWADVIQQALAGQADAVEALRSRTQGTDFGERLTRGSSSRGKPRRRRRPIAP